MNKQSTPSTPSKSPISPSSENSTLNLLLTPKSHIQPKKLIFTPQNQLTPNSKKKKRTEKQREYSAKLRKRQREAMIELGIVKFTLIEQKEEIERLEKEKKEHSTPQHLIGNITTTQTFNQLTLDTTKTITPLIQNINTLFNTFPSNSTLKSSLLLALKPNVDPSFLSYITSQSQFSINNSDNSKDIKKFKISYTSTKTTLLSFEQMETILDDICPVISGRNYRILETSLKFLYLQYKAKAALQFPDLGCGSPSYFYSFISTINLRRSEIKALCPHCETWDELDDETKEKDRIKKHQEHAKNQQVRC